MGKKILMVFVTSLVIFRASGFCYAVEKTSSAQSDAANLPGTQSWDPMEELDNIHKKIDRVFRESFSRVMKEEKELTRANKEGFDVKVSVKETKSAYIVSADLPGMNKEDINVELKGNLLTVSGQRKSEMKTENERMLREEQSFGAFSNTMSLPEDVKASGITAEYKNGVLNVTVPRIETAKKTAEAGIKIPIK